jgi:hypothetical protein
VPPVPLQVIEYVVLVVSPAVDCDPLDDFLPDQPPDVEHDVASLLKGQRGLRRLSE